MVEGKLRVSSFRIAVTVRLRGNTTRPHFTLCRSGHSEPHEVETKTERVPTFGLAVIIFWTCSIPGSSRKQFKKMESTPEGEIRYLWLQYWCHFVTFSVFYRFLFLITFMLYRYFSSFVMHYAPTCWYSCFRFFANL